jgi:hypothetical protein
MLGTPPPPAIPPPHTPQRRNSVKLFAVEKPLLQHLQHSAVRTPLTASAEPRPKSAIQTYFSQLMLVAAGETVDSAIRATTHSEPSSPVPLDTAHAFVDGDDTGSTADDIAAAVWGARRNVQLPTVCVHPAPPKRVPSSGAAWVSSNDGSFSDDDGAAEEKEVCVCSR